MRCSSAQKQMFKTGPANWMNLVAAVSSLECWECDRFVGLTITPTLDPSPPASITPSSSIFNLDITVYLSPIFLCEFSSDFLLLDAAYIVVIGGCLWACPTDQRPFSPELIDNTQGSLFP